MSLTDLVLVSAGEESSLAGVILSLQHGLHHVPSRVADRFLVLRPGVRLAPQRWEGQVQDIGPSETSWPHIISIGESSPQRPLSQH